MKVGIAKMTEAIYENMCNNASWLLITQYIIESGYAGVNRNGTIVDRRIYPDAVPIQPTSFSNAPKPKEL